MSSLSVGPSAARLRRWTVGLLAILAVLSGFALSARGANRTGPGRALLAGHAAAFALFFLVLGYWNALGWRL